MEVELTWTFPMSYYEIITGDGEKVFRERIELSDLGAFGKKTFNKKVVAMGYSH